MISLGLKSFDGLRLCSQLRSLERTRTIPILAISPLEDRMRLLRGLEIGVNDYLVPPVDKNELLAAYARRCANDATSSVCAMMCKAHWSSQLRMR